MPVISASRSTHHAAEQQHGFDTGPCTHSGAPCQAVAASIRVGHWGRARNQVLLPRPAEACADAARMFQRQGGNTDLPFG